MSLITPKTALISLSNKSHLDELIKFLLDQEVKIISTGGTYNAIKKITDQVIEVSEFTGFEEMMDGRVKTLHPKIHAGILARRELDLEVLTDRGYEVIDMVIVNLYPFQETVASGCSFEEAIEKLQELDTKLLWQNNEIKKYYSELTEIVRAYIEKELKIPALEITTHELVDILSVFNKAKTIDASKETIKKLNALLQEADLVKFAKSTPLSHEIEEDRRDAEEVLYTLKPSPITEETKDDELE